MEWISNAIKSTWNAAMSGWHHGKGGKYTRKGDYRLALKHFSIALEHARIVGNEGDVAVNLECVARSHYRLGQYSDSKKFAGESLSIYRKLHLLEEKGNGLFNQAGQRVSDLLKEIELKEIV